MDPPNYYDLLATQARTQPITPTFWRQKLDVLGYPSDMNDPQSFYFIVTGFSNPKDLITAVIRFDSRYLAAVMSVKNIPHSIFLDGVMSSIAFRVDDDDLPLLPRWVLEYISANVEKFVTDHCDISDFADELGLWLYARLSMMTPAERVQYVTVTSPLLSDPHTLIGRHNKTLG